MSLYSNFLSVTGGFAKRAYYAARDISCPIVKGITNIAEKVRKASSALTIIPIVGQVAGTLLTVSTAVAAVGSVISDMLGPEPTPPAPERRWETETMIFDADREMDRAMAEDRDGDIRMREPLIAKETVETPRSNPMTYLDRPIAPLRGRRVYPSLKLDPPDFAMYDIDADVPYDRPEDRRVAKRQYLMSVA